MMLRFFGRVYNLGRVVEYKHVSLPKIKIKSRPATRPKELLCDHLVTRVSIQNRHYYDSITKVHQCFQYLKWHNTNYIIVKWWPVLLECFPQLIKLVRSGPYSRLYTSLYTQSLTKYTRCDDWKMYYFRKLVKCAHYKIKQQRWSKFSNIAI